MNLLHYIPLRLVSFYILGILTWQALPTQGQYPLSLLFVVLLFLAGTVYFNVHKISNNYVFAIAVFLVFFNFGAFSLSKAQELNYKNHYSKLCLQAEQLFIVKLIEELKPSRNARSYYARVLKINASPSKGHIKITLLKIKTPTNFKIDDYLVFKTSLVPIKKPLNPFQFNYKKYLAKKQIHHQLYIYESELYKVSNSSTSIRGWASNFRKRIQVSLKTNGFKGDELAMINALLLGQRQEMSQQLLQQYKDAGAIHILAVSGLHLGIILLLLHAVLGPLERIKYGKTFKLILIIALLWIYAVIAGMSSSVIRSVVMFTALAVALASSRSVNSFKALVISLFLLLLFDPYYLFDVGFQLSYLALSSILYLQPILSQFYRPKQRFKNYIWQLTTVSLAAQIGVLPLSIYYFNQFPGLFLLANLIIIPCLGFILGLGILIIFLSLIGLLPKFLVNFYEFILFYLNTTVKAIAHQELFIFKSLVLSGFSLLVCYLFIILLFRGLQLKTSRNIKWLFLIIVSMQLYQLFSKIKNKSLKQFLIFNKHRQTLIGFKGGSGFYLFHDLDSSAYQDPILNNYLSNNYINKTYIKKPLKDLYLVENELLLILNDNKLQDIKTYRPTTLLLRKSPAINLDRLFKNCQINLVIADASNYASYIKLWQRSCKKYQVPFYNTAKEGAFIRNY